MSRSHKTLKAPPREPDAPVAPVNWLTYTQLAIAFAMMFYVGMMLLPSVGG